MSQTDFIKYTHSSEFKELLAKYEQTVDSGDNVYFTSDDLIDIAEYYHINGRIEASLHAAEYCAELHDNNDIAMLFIARIHLMDKNDVATARCILNKINADECENYMEYVYVNAEAMLMEDNNAKGCDSYLLREYGRLCEKLSSAPEDQFTPIDDDEDDEDDEGEDLQLQRDLFPLDVAILYCDHNNPYLAEKWFRKIPNPPQDHLFEYWETSSRIYVSTQRYEEAIEPLNKALDIDAYSIPLWLQLCEAQFRTSNTEDALQSIDYALAISPLNAEALLVKANLLYELQKMDQARIYFEKLKSVAPDEPQAYVSLGALSLYDQDVTTAMEYFKTAMEKSGYDIIITLYIGICMFDYRLYTSAYIIFDTIITPFNEIEEYGEVPNELFPYLAACCKVLHHDALYKKYLDLAHRYTPQDFTDMILRIANTTNNQEE